MFWTSDMQWVRNSYLVKLDFLLLSILILMYLNLHLCLPYWPQNYINIVWSSPCSLLLIITYHNTLYSFRIWDALVNMVIFSSSNSWILFRFLSYKNFFQDKFCVSWCIKNGSDCAGEPLFNCELWDFKTSTYSTYRTKA